MEQAAAPRISIIVPVYNTAPWLPRCLDSITAQTFPHWECILVDDGSTDGSGAVCDEYAARDSRFTVIHKENGGLSSARNAGLDVARGNYIQFLDSDDSIAPELVGYAVQLQDSEPGGMVIWSYTSDPEEYARALQTPVSSRQTLFSRECWQQALFVESTTRLYLAAPIRSGHLRFDLSLGLPGVPGEDADFNQRYFAAAYGAGDFPLQIIQPPCYFYCQENDNSLMHIALNQQWVERSELPAPERGYLADLLTHWESVFHGMSPAEQDRQARDLSLHFLRCFAFGLWSARQLNEPLPKGFFRSEGIRQLLDLAKKHRIFSVYYLPFRWGFAALAAKIYVWDERQSMNYWRCYELIYRLFFRGWEK